MAKSAKKTVATKPRKSRRSPTRSTASRRGGDHAGRGRHALIIVDLQQAFPVPPRLVLRIQRYAARFECRVFTRFINPPGSLFRRHLKQHSCAPGSADTALLLPPGRGDLVIAKRTYGLAPRDLARLRRRGIKRATVCGVDTDACVLGVMFSLFDAGIACRAMPQLCWSSSGLQAPALRIIREQFAAF